MFIALMLAAAPLGAQLSRTRILDERPQFTDQKDALQKKTPTGQRERIPLDGVIDRDEYLLGPGDELEVSIWGDQQYQSHNLYVSAEGRLLIPSVGPVEVGLLSVNRAEDVLRDKAASFFTNADLSLSLVNPRLFRVFLVGGVFEPGTYYMSAMDRVSDLIKEGGGLKPEASWRNLKLLDRDSDLVGNVDLMAWNAGGGTRFNPRLSDGCTVEVPSIREYVTLRGYFVNLSGTDSVKINDYLKEEASEYRVEFLAGESLRDLLKLTGLPREFDNGSNRKEVIVENMGRRKAVSIEDSELDEPLSVGLVYEFPVRTQWVYVTGNVTRGGRFLYAPGLTVNDYLGQAGGANWSGSDNVCMVTRSDGSRDKVSSTDEVGPGDLLYVPGRVQWLDRMIGPMIGLLGVLIAVTAN